MWCGVCCLVQWRLLDAKMRFIQAVVSGKIELRNRKRSVLAAQLLSLGFQPNQPAAGRASARSQAEEGRDDSDSEPASAASSGAAQSYDYLLRMPMCASLSLIGRQMECPIVSNTQSCAMRSSKARGGNSGVCV